MKNIIASLLVLIPMVQLAAQREYLPTPDDLNRFKSTKTYVVLADNPLAEYNFEIRDAIKETWTLTEYEFLEYDDFAEKSLDLNASFLYIAVVNLEKDKTNARYNFLCLSLGGPDHNTIDELKDISNIPLGYYGVDEELYLDHLRIILRFMQGHVTRLIAEPALVSQNVFQHYNKNMSQLKDKVLYLVEDELAPDINAEARVREVYPYPFKIVDRDKVRELLASGDEKAVLLHKVGPQNKNLSARVYKMLIGVADAKLYYFNYHKASDKKPDAILKNDLKRIGKAPTK